MALIAKQGYQTVLFVDVSNLPISREKMDAADLADVQDSTAARAYDATIQPLATATYATTKDKIFAPLPVRSVSVGAPPPVVEND